MNRFRHRSEWNQNRSFKKGEVYFVNFPPEPQKGSESSKLMEGPHRAVVLFDSTFPRKTVVVIPISSCLNFKGEKRPRIHTDVILNVSKYDKADSPYQGTIKSDSFMMTNQIRSVSRNYLERHIGMILPEDMLKLQFQLIRTLDLGDAIEAIVQERLQELIGDEYEEEA